MDQTLEASAKQLVQRVEGISPATVAKPTLVYFNIIGICWPIRCLLHIHDIDYDYVPISIREWGFRAEDGSQPLKRAFRNGHVPLYVDQKVALNQSNLILTRLARQTNMFGDNEAEELTIQEIMAHCYDALFHWNGMLQIAIRINIKPEVAEARLNAFMGDGVWGIVTNGYRNHLNTFVKFLEANRSNSGFLVGDRLSAADLHAFNVLCNWYKAFDREVFSREYPQLDSFIQRVAKVPGVRDYILNVQEATTWFPWPEASLRLVSPEELDGLVSLGAD